MGEPFIASVQYGDLKGTVSIDGHEAGGPLRDLAKHTCLKTGYWPIGFGLDGLDPNSDGKVSITVFGVDQKTVGGTVDEIRTYVEKHGGKLPVVGFRGEITAGSFAQLFKRFSLRAHSKGLGLEPEALDIAGYKCGEDDH